MVFFMVTVKVDKQGRLILPISIRERIGLTNGGKVTIRLSDSNVILEPISENFKERVDDWITNTLNTHPIPFTEKTPDSWKWMSGTYAKRKLGIH